jgi:transposase
MRCVREILRLRAEELSDRAIARSTGLARSTVREYVGRTKAAGLAWPLPPELSDTALEALLFGRTGVAPGTRRKPEPDWASLHRELRRPGVTLMLLWQEYRATQPEGYGYSRFCELYEGWEGRLSPTMRQVHPAGERLFVDYAGQTVELIDGTTGEVHRAQVFVAVLGASSYTYAEATLTQTLPDWIGAHGRALAFFGGVPRQIVPDNPKVGVLRANWYEPGLNPTYQDFATHYGPRATAARQGQGRGRRAGGGALDPGAPAPSALLLAGRAQWRHQNTARRTQQPADAPPGCEPTPALRGAGSTGLGGVAGRAIRLRRMAPTPRRARLSRRH